jgi:hypothetical protein
MKIAQIAPLYEAVPPSLYGGTERIVAHLTNALVELGHDVTLFASAEVEEISRACCGSLGDAASTKWCRFSDQVGSTALSARMDPEDLREVISASQKRVPKTVQRFDGFVARYMGDGVLVYFGYPRAHEDDAERAVQAGLELVRVVTALSLKICEV